MHTIHERKRGKFYQNLPYSSLSKIWSTKCWKGPGTFVFVKATTSSMICRAASLEIPVFSIMLWINSSMFDSFLLLNFLYTLLRLHHKSSDTMVEAALQVKGNYHG